MHIDAQCKNISKNIALLRKAKFFVPLHTLIKMYNALYFHIRHIAQQYGIQFHS